MKKIISLVIIFAIIAIGIVITVNVINFDTTEEPEVPNDVYDVKYILNDGYAEDNPITYSIDNGSVELNNPLKSDYFCGNWYLEEELTTKITHLNETLLEEFDTLEITLYAGYQVLSDFIFEDTDYSGATYEYIYFGKYPQSVELDSSIISELDKLSPNENGYYTYNQEEYYKQTTNLIDDDYEWISGGLALNETSYYFKVEPIKWRVIQNDGTIQVLSEYILDESLYFTSEDDRIIDGETIYSNNYEHSTLREYLNDSFLNRAFSTIEQNLIKTTMVENENLRPAYELLPTFDKLYVLTFYDLLNTDYGFSSEYGYSDTRGAVVTDFALANGAIKSDEKNLGYWALRSTMYTEYYAYGEHESSFGEAIKVHTEGVGIRPAFTFA